MPANADMAFMIGLVLVDHACQTPAYMDDEEFAKLVDTVMRVASSNQGVDELFLRAGGCRVDQRVPTEAEVQSVIVGLDTMPMTPERHRLELLSATYQIRARNLDRAFELTTRALALPWAGSFVNNSPTFVALRDSVHGPALRRLSFKTAPAPSFEMCERRER